MLFRGEVFRSNCVIGLVYADGDVTCALVSIWTRTMQRATGVRTMMKEAGKQVCRNAAPAIGVMNWILRTVG